MTRKSVPLKKALVGAQLRVAMLVLGICALAFLTNSLWTTNQAMRGQLESTAHILGLNLVPTIAFNDARVASEILSSLRAEPKFTDAVVLDAKAKPFARYAASPGPEWMPEKEQEGHSGSLYVVRHELKLDGEQVGTLFMRAQTGLGRTLLMYALITFAVLAFGMILSALMGNSTQQRVSYPVVSLLRAMRKLSEGEVAEAEISPALSGITEVESLASEFRFMARQIRARDALLQEVNESLEHKVELRTRELQAAHAALVGSGRLAALGEMAAGVAHEINNPLAIIQAKAESLAMQAERGKVDATGIRAACESITATTMRIARIIRGLRTFSRDGASDPLERVNVKTIIGEALDLCRNRFVTHGVEVRLGLIPEDALVLGRPTQLGQVLLNLLNNAHDAVEGLSEKWVSISVSEETNGVPSTAIEISDSGFGIPAELRARIMEPFFTTKELGKGTGLGLSISLGIIQSHQGKLEVLADRPHTTFRITLPAPITDDQPNLIRGSAHP